jgi:hypothetical protein
VIVVTLLTLLAMVAADPAPASFPENRWAEPTRGILAQHCGQCHLPNLPTSVPRALAVFNLVEEPWYGRLTHDQFATLLERMRSIRELTESDKSLVESFVRCARDRDCPRADP